MHNYLTIYYDAPTCFDTIELVGNTLLSYTHLLMLLGKVLTTSSLRMTH